MNTPNHTPNPAAQALGRLSKGKPKTLSTAERERRRQAMLAILAKRREAKAQAVKLCDLPDGMVDRMDGELYELCQAAGYDIAPRNVIDQWNFWDCTLGEFKAQLQHIGKDQAQAQAAYQCPDCGREYTEPPRECTADDCPGKQ